MEEIKDTPNKHGKAWIFWTCGAVTCFTIGNAAISEISLRKDGGVKTFFYLSPGGILAGFCYNFAYMIKEKKSWNNQNIIVDGKFKK